MTHTRFSVALCLLLVGLFSLSGALHAQKKQKEPSAPVERKVVKDEAGLQQWAEYKGMPCPRCRTAKKIDCPNCKDTEHAKACLECGEKKNPITKKAPCRLCAGIGTMPDPLVEAPCMGCFGSSIFYCYGCRGEQGYPVEGGGKKRQKCSVCKGAGALTCTICKGKRRCAALNVKKGLANASLKDLRAAATIVEDAMSALRDFTPTGVKARKELKHYQGILKKLSKVCKPAKKASSMAKALLQSASKMDQYRGSEDRKAAVFKTFSQYNLFYLDHQLQALKLAIKRAEHNEKVIKAAKQK